ncbi:hypothetical protein BRADI_4g12887v3 [Brachypodium distachyon]|uniref:Zinc finger GRF-type domain-containing protein n=1 Tax=Brachypodium distachyon TaxID=15368 RepID=A0A0Q3EN14_BRADI|nr:hypothetical protein BRADI_4g12887v3 [Brachypodium distachyon]
MDRSSGSSTRWYGASLPGSSGGSSSSFPPLSSPIPYREKPMEYSPAVLRDCGMKSPRWISWSLKNPGRSTTHAPYVSGGCSFFRWHDPAATSFLRDLIGDLRDCCVKSKKENEMLKSELGDVEMQLLQTKQKLDDEEKKVVSLQNDANRTRNEMRSLKIFIFFPSLCLSLCYVGSDWYVESTEMWAVLPM